MRIHSDLMWMNLESVIQSEISQKEKKYQILVHIQGFQRDGTDDSQAEQRHSRQEQALDSAEKGECGMSGEQD